MKVFPLLLLIMISFVSAAEINGFINDYANVIDNNYKIQIEQNLKDMYDAGTVQFSIVTIQSLEGRDIEGYALELAQGNLGNENNNGLLLLVAIDERKYRFEVGRGIEPILNDAKIGRVGREYLVDNFKNGDYGKGIYETTNAIKTIMSGEELEVIPMFDPGKAFIVIGFMIIIFVIIIFAAIKSGIKTAPGKNNTDHYFNAAMIASMMLRGGRGGSFGGGGFGGFGGGSFGGGGASGGW